MSNIILTYNNRIIDYASVVPFSPLDYTPIAWYDSSDVSTISKDISDRVSQWDDKSGLGYHLVQSVDLNKPIYSGGTGIVFDGSDDYMSNTSLNLSTNITIFIITKFNTEERCVLGSTSNLTTSRFMFYSYLNNELRLYRGTNAHIFTKTYPQNQYIYTLCFNDGLTPSLYQNNTLQVNGNGNINAISTIGFKIGQLANGAYSFDSYIKEVIIYNSTLTPDQITTVNNYLNAKYNIY